MDALALQVVPSMLDADQGRIAAELKELEEAGAEAVEAPLIRIAPPADYGPLDEACARVGSFNWIVFPSVNAVDASSPAFFFMSFLLWLNHIGGRGELWLFRLCRHQ